MIAEDHGLPNRAGTAGYLVSLTNGERFQIFQDLGPGAKGCHLAGNGALAAAKAVRLYVASGCDLVVLSKFGHLEKNGGGLRRCLHRRHRSGHSCPDISFAGVRDGLGELCRAVIVMMPPDPEQIDAWWQ